MAISQDWVRARVWNREYAAINITLTHSSGKKNNCYRLTNFVNQHKKVCFSIASGGFFLKIVSIEIVGKYQQK